MVLLMSQRFISAMATRVKSRLELRHVKTPSKGERVKPCWGHNHCTTTTPAKNKERQKMSKYIGYDKTATGKNPATEKLVELCNKRWGAKNLGTWVVRDIRGKEGQKSVHSTGRAADILIEDKDKKKQAIVWFTRDDVVKGLGIQAIHVYNYGVWGKGWKVGRGWKQWTALDNGGSKNAAWLHVEIDYTHKTAESFETAWRNLPKPG